MNYIGRGWLGIGAATLAACLLLAPPQSHALTSSEIFADGNRLFRDDLYWAALLRYQQAYEAGMDTPLLHYNTGVAHYRAGQHIRARTSLLKAVQDPGLRVISQYNLGLTAYAAGDVEEALNWFRQARDQEQRGDIKNLAIIAISRLQTEKREDDVLLARVEKRKTKPEFTDLDVRAFVGFGTDDNVFRTPGQDYIDFADPALPLVTPEVVSGAFVPIDVQLKYSINSLKYESFYAAYRAAGRLYQDKELENANEYSHEFSFGSSYQRANENRERRVFSAFTFAQHDETYFDPDDGTAREVGIDSIDNRMNYTRYGPEMAWVQAYDRFALGLRVQGQLWNYEDPEVVPEYDHEYFVFAAHAQYEFTRSSLLRVTVDKYSRRYGDRPAFDLDGNQPITNPDLRYDYLAAGLTARQRITDNMWVGLNAELTDREDRYLGYNDYRRSEYGFDFSWTASARLRFEVGSYYRNYDYPNAYAFHNPVAGEKTLETLRSKVLAEFRMTQHLSITAEAELYESVSTDTRIGYDRNWFSLGVSWQQ